jgi:hypothetical protein
MLHKLFKKIYYGPRPLMMQMVKYVEQTTHTQCYFYKTPIYCAIYYWNDYNNVMHLINLYKYDQQKLNKINKCINQVAFSVQYDNSYNIFANKEKEHQVIDLIEYLNFNNQKHKTFDYENCKSD